MDNLEKHIRDNRPEFDRYEPSPEIWNRVSGRISLRRKHVIKWLSAAAIVTVVIGTAFVLFTANQKKGAAYNAANTREPGLNETEMYYNTMANTLYRQAVPLMTMQPDIEKELRSGMAHIDSICMDIKKDLKDNVDNQEVIEALIQNYRIKINLLEEMLNLLKKNENSTEKIKSHEM
jgi:CHASE3 domain sensor protein